jgi:RNA polymerase sigma factor (sigma-70 family)
MSRAANDLWGDEGEGGEGGEGSAQTETRRRAVRVAGGVQMRLTDEQQKLVLSVQRLVESEVHALARSARDAERKDLVARGHLGAMLAAMRYEPSMETRFSTYATTWIRGEIWAALREEERQSALARAAFAASRDYLAEEPDSFDVVWDSEEVNGARLDRLAERAVAARVLGMGSEPLTPEDALSEREAHANAMKLVRAALAKMTTEEQALVALRFGQQRELSDLVRELGMNERTARRHLEKVLDKLHAVLVEHGITEAPALRDRTFAWSGAGEQGEVKR